MADQQSITKEDALDLIYYGFIDLRMRGHKLNDPAVFRIADLLHNLPGILKTHVDEKELELALAKWGVTKPHLPGQEDWLKEHLAIVRERCARQPPHLTDS